MMCGANEWIAELNMNIIDLTENSFQRDAL